MHPVDLPIVVSAQNRGSVRFAGGMILGCHLPDHRAGWVPGHPSPRRV